jgi:hypothetical protein
VLWLSTTDEPATPARIADLADTFTTIADAHQRTGVDAPTTAQHTRTAAAQRPSLGQHPERQQSGRGGPPPRRADTGGHPLADRLGRTRLSEPWRQLLTEYDTAARAAHRRHLTLRWRTPTAGIDEPDHTLSGGELGFDD